MDKFNDEEFQKKYLKIKKKLVINKNSVEFPKVFVLGGQPGAGKSTLTSKIEESMDKNIIAINGDDFRSSHPNYDNLIKTYGDDSVLYTQKFSNTITEKLIEDLGNEKYNLIVEGTLRTTEAPLKTSKLLHGKGYSTNLNIVCVKPEFSYLGTLERYQEMKKNGLIARATPKESHDNVVTNFAENLSKIYLEKEFDNIEIFTREGKSLYSLKDTPNINPGEIIKKEFDRELTIEEKKKLIEKDEENSKKMKLFMEKFEEKENEVKSIGDLLQARKLYDKYLSMETRILSKLENVLIQRDFESFISSGYTLSSLDNVWDIVKIEYKNISKEDKETLKEVFAFFLNQINKRFKEAKYGLVQAEVGENFDAVNQVDLSQNSRGSVTECVFYGYGFLKEKENPDDEDVVIRRIKNPLVLTV